MTSPIPGSEAFANRTVHAEDILDRISPKLRLHPKRAWRRRS